MTDIVYISVITVLSAVIVLQAYFHREYSLTSLIRHMEHARSLHGDIRTLTESLVRDSGHMLKFQPSDPRPVTPAASSSFNSNAWKPDRIATPPAIPNLANEKGKL